MPFGSLEVKDFGNEYGIKKTTSSPMYAQFNGQAERFVQSLKGLLKKVDEEGSDPYLALLDTETHNFLVSSILRDKY